MNIQIQQEQATQFRLCAAERSRPWTWPEAIISLTASEISWSIDDSAQRIRPLRDIQTISLFLVGLPRGGERFTCAIDFGDAVVSISSFADPGPRQQLDAYREFVLLLHQHVLAQQDLKISYRTGSPNRLLKPVVAVATPILSCILFFTAFTEGNFGALLAAVAVAVAGGLKYQNLIANKPASYSPEAIPARLLP